MILSLLGFGPRKAVKAAEGSTAPSQYLVDPARVELATFRLRSERSPV